MSIREGIPDKRARLLFINNQTDQKLIAYIFGQARIYVDHVTQLGTCMAQVSVRYDDDADVDRLLGASGPARMYRLAASCTYESKSGEPHKWTDKSSQFLDTAARKMLPAVKGRTICIFSSDKPLRNAFYRSAVRVNSDKGFGCNFDYNHYDDRIELRHIVLPSKKRSKWLRYRILIYVDQYARKIG